VGYPVTAEGVGAGRGIAVVLTWIADLAITFAPAFATVVMFHEPALRRAWHVKRWVPLTVVIGQSITTRLAARMPCPERAALGRVLVAIWITRVAPAGTVPVMVQMMPLQFGTEVRRWGVVVAGRVLAAAGVSGVAAGVTVTALEAAPGPMLLTARSLTRYAVPLVRPVMVIGDAVEDGLRVVHEVPLSVEYS